MVPVLTEAVEVRVVSRSNAYAESDGCGEDVTEALMRVSKVFGRVEVALPSLSCLQSFDENRRPKRYGGVDR